MSSPSLTEDVHVLIPGTCEHVTFQGKTDSAEVIKSRVLRMGITLDDPDGPNVIIKVLIRRRQEGVRVREGGVTIKAEVGMMPLPERNTS